MPTVNCASRQRIQDSVVPTLGSGTLVECDSRQRIQDSVNITDKVQCASRQRIQDSCTPIKVLTLVECGSRQRIQESVRTAPTVQCTSRQKLQDAGDATGAGNRTASVHSVPDGTNPGTKEDGASTSW